MTNAENSFTIEMVTMKVSFYTIMMNLMLALIKLIVGILASSGAMVSDAIHSASDVCSVFIVIIGVKMANKTSDEKHPYGHERLECVASIVLAMVLAVTGGGIGYHGIRKIYDAETETILVPGMAALAVSILSVLVKEMMYWYTRGAAKKINSGVLMAEAWHNRTDALASVGSFAGILGARLGVPAMDPAAGVVISLFIIKAAADIFRDAVKKMIDVSCDDRTVRQIWQIAEKQKGVICVAEVKTRLFGNKKYVDIAVCADGRKTLEETHGIAEGIHKKIEENIDGVKHCRVYVSPAGKEDENWLR